MVKPFRVFEAGAGKHPVGLVKKAARSEKKGKKREFIGVDYELNGFNLETAIRKSGLEKKPKNLKTYSGCAIRQLEKLPKGSQNIVFGGLVLHQIVLQNPSHKKGVEDAKRFLRAAKRALAPNGRIVLIQHLKDKAFFETIAKETGFRTYVREMKQKECEQSESTFLKQLSTLDGRKEIVNGIIKKANNQVAQAVEIEDLAKERGLQSPYDLYKPIFVVLRP